MLEVINTSSFPVVFNGQFYAKALNALHGFLEYPNSILLIYSTTPRRKLSTQESILCLETQGTPISSMG